MISRVFVRTVLVAIVALMIGAIVRTWFFYIPENVALHVLLTILEGAVLLAALSLLIESFRSFGTITVNKNSWWYVLSGSHLFGTETPSAKICEIMLARSFVLALFSILILGFATASYITLVGLVDYIWNPYPLHVSLETVVTYLGIAVFVIAVGLFATWGYERLDQRLKDKTMVVRVVVLGLYVCLGCGFGVGVTTYYVDVPSSPPLYMATLFSTIVASVVLLISGLMVGIGYGLYRLVGKATERYPILENVWNTICPVQRIDIVE